MRGLFFALGQVAGKSVGADGIAAVVAGWWSGIVLDEHSIPKALAVLAILVMLDWVTGIRANHYTEKAPIQSAKLARTADKAGAYGIYILVFWLLSHQIPGLIEYRTSIVLGLSGYFSLNESWSICENLDRVGFPIPAWLRRRLRRAIDEMDAKEDAGIAQGFKPLG